MWPYAIQSAICCILKNLLLILRILFIERSLPDYTLHLVELDPTTLGEKRRVEKRTVLMYTSVDVVVHKVVQLRKQKSCYIVAVNIET